jgi:hypothetical protein
MIYNGWKAGGNQVHGARSHTAIPELNAVKIAETISENCCDASASSETSAQGSSAKRRSLSHLFISISSPVVGGCAWLDQMRAHSSVVAQSGANHTVKDLVTRDSTHNLSFLSILHLTKFLDSAAAGQGKANDKFGSGTSE